MPHSNDNREETLWGYDEVSEYLDIAPRTARKWVSERGLPHLRIGNVVRFRPDAVRAWVRENESSAAR